jgi:ABC-type Zn uptake system ZnuABC Zn-binding protein ZnuA
MSALRDIRLLVARHLELQPNAKAAILDVMNILDASLDAEGYEPPAELTTALRRLDHIIVFGDDFEEVNEEDALADDDNLVDLNDIFGHEEEDDDEDA